MAAQQETGAVVDQEAEGWFWKWLACYKNEELGGTMLSRFLTADHLKAAFMAGLEAGREETPRD
jgi:hypothetical protein